MEDLKGLGRRGRPNRFLTLTVNPSWGNSPEERAQRLVVAWRYIRQQAQRELGIKHIAFMAVFEKTKAGEPHLHILIRGKWLAQRWISAKMAQYMDAPIVDIKAVDNPGRAVAYVTKYCGKDPQHFQGCKRYWRSQDYELPEEKAKTLGPVGGLKWEIRDAYTSFIVEQHIRRGWGVMALSPNKWLLRPPDAQQGFRAC